MRILSKLKLPIICAALLCTTCTTLFSAQLPVFAADNTGGACDASLPEEIREANGCNKNNGNKVPAIITNILTAIIAVLGVVSAIYVFIGGITYMTSSGDSGKVEKAKKTILYALIGLVISALSFAIVNFTIDAINRGANGGTSEESGDN